MIGKRSVKEKTLYKDTIIFDLDGTLLNTIEDLADSTNYALAAFDLPARSVQEVRQFVGNGVDLLIKRAVDGALPQEREQECLAVFKQHYSENMYHKTRPYDGIPELVHALRAENYHIGIVSNKFDSAVKALNHIYFHDMFPVAIGASDTVAKKPAPDSVIEALKSLSSNREHALYVGDSDVDVITAKNAGLPFIGVTWGFRDEELLRSMGAECVLERPQQLLELLK